jgi:hypothetical protein
MFWQISLRNANIGLLVCVLVMAIGTAVFDGRNASDVEEQIIVWGSLAAGFATLFVLDYRQERADPECPELDSNQRPSP